MAEKMRSRRDVFVEGSRRHDTAFCRYSLIQHVPYAPKFRDPAPPAPLMPMAARCSDAERCKAGVADGRVNHLSH